MEEITAGVMAAAPEAPPGDGTAEAPPAPVAEAQPAAAAPIDVTQLPNFDDPAATEAWIAASTAATNAQAEGGETVVEAADPTPTAEAATIAAAPRSESAEQAQPDYQAVIADLQARGFKVEAPAPPPDPYSALTAELAPIVGTPEAYAQAKAKATAPLPALPADSDPDWQDKMDAHQAAIAERNAASTQLHQFDAARQTTDLSKRWARQAVLGEIGASLDPIPGKYGLNPEQAARVVTPTALTDAIDAVADAVNASWQAKYDAREKYWEGRVKQAGTDRTAENVRRMGTAPQVGGRQGAPAGPGPVWDADPKNPSLPSEAWIQKAISGQLSGIDLSDR